MNPLNRFLALVGPAIALALLSCTVAAQEKPAASAIDESRKVANDVFQDIRSQLKRELEISGPLHSLLVCKYACPEILSSRSRKTGWRIAAVSLRPRNLALGMADAWEQKVLLDLKRRNAAGESALTLEFAEVVSEPQGRYFRYANAIIVEPMCLACHGTREQIGEAVKAQLAKDYPFDQALNFSIGQLYGIVSVKRGLK